MMDSVYKKTIKKEFAFLKKSNRYDEVLSKGIPLDSGGILIPVCDLHKEDAQLIKKLAKWRKAAEYAYPSRFYISFNGTKNWLHQILSVEDRILFLILNKYGDSIGHVGFANCFNELHFMEADNIVRGEFDSPGIMSESLQTVLEWARTRLWPEGFYLRVLKSNLKAINFYEKNGWNSKESIPLKKIFDGNRTYLHEIDPGKDDEIEDYFIKMYYELSHKKIGEKLILTAGPSISAREQYYTADAVRHGWNSQSSKYLSRLEETFAEYVGCRYAIATSSCTGALHIALATLGIGKGDEVIVPDITWVATANAVIYVGATPIFADVSADSWCLDPRSFESLITDKTKAVIPVHLYGNPAKMDEILDIANRYNLYVIEDAAPSIGAEINGRRTGSFGHFAAFSFQGAKLAVAGEGGVLVTDDEELYRTAYQLWDQGRRPGTFWIETSGLKYKMSNIQAAIALGQIERVDEMVEAKRRIFKRYADNLSGLTAISMNYEAKWAKSIYWMSSILLSRNSKLSRKDLMCTLKDKNVDTRPVFPTISQYPIWQLEYEPKPIAHYISLNAINLPSGVCLSISEVDYVSEQIIKALS